MRERLAPKIGPTRITSKDFSLWPEEKQAISTKSLKEAFLTFTHLPMIPSTDCLKETIMQGVAEGQFAYARGSAEKNEFHSVRIGVAVDQSIIEFLEETYLLRPKFAYELLGTLSPPKEKEPTTIGPEPRGQGEPPTPPRGGPELYQSVSVTSDLDWKKWMEFHDAVLQPLINAGAALRIKVEATGTSEEGISPNTLELVIKESLTSYGIPANIQTKKKGEESKEQAP